MMLAWASGLRGSTPAQDSQEGIRPGDRAATWYKHLTGQHVLPLFFPWWCWGKRPQEPVPTQRKGVRRPAGQAGLPAHEAQLHRRCPLVGLHWRGWDRAGVHWQSSRVGAVAPEPWHSLGNPALQAMPTTPTQPLCPRLLGRVLSARS